MAEMIAFDMELKKAWSQDFFLGGGGGCTRKPKFNFLDIKS